MFTNTGGTFTGDPAINTTYYLEYPVEESSSEELVILTAPTISIDNSILTIINNDENTTSFDIYTDGVYATNVIKTAETGGQITDLTGTIWLLEEPIYNYNEERYFEVSAIVSSSDYTLLIDYIETDDMDGVYLYKEGGYYFYWSYPFWDYSEDTYSYRTDAPTIEFLGGNDVDNQYLIEWLEDNATQLLADTTIDISTLSLGSGTHNITVKAKAIGYEDSVASNAVSYIVN